MLTLKKGERPRPVVDEISACVAGGMSHTGNAEYQSEKVVHNDAIVETLDAAIIAGGQKVEHLEIACYGTAAQLAKKLGMNEVEQILAQSLEEEKTTDAKLSQIAITSVNRRSQMAGV